MGDNTPTIDEVRAAYIGEPAHWMDEKVGSEFDRFIRHIQAEALRSALADIQAYTDAGAPFGHRPVEQFLSLRAARVEAGELG